MDLKFPAKTHEAALWPLPPGQADAIALFQLARESEHPICVICRSVEQTEHLETTLNALRDAQDPPVSSVPDWETLPYDSFSPHDDIISRRIATLSGLPALERGIILIALTTALHRFAPRSFICGNRIDLNTGQKLDSDSYRKQLTEAGYRAVDTVYQHGEFAVRGSILDIFPMGSDSPVRIDLFDNEIETLRTFDPETQRTVDRIEQFRILPAHEYPLTRDGRARFLESFDSSFPDTPISSPLRQDTGKGIASPGLEYYLPLFFEDMGNLFSYLPETTRLVLYPDLQEAAEHFWQEVRHRHDQLAHDIQRPVLAPHQIFLPTDEFFAALKIFSRARFSGKDGAAAGHTLFDRLPDIAVKPRETEPLAALKQWQSKQPLRLTVCAESPGRAEVLGELFKDNGLDSEICHTDESQGVWSLLQSMPNDRTIRIIVLPLTRGFIDNRQASALIAEPDLFADRVPQRRRRKRSAESGDGGISSLSELKIGTPVVHLDHGVGRYQGLTSLEVDGQAQEFLLLMYANDSKLYVPVAALHLISRYSGQDEALAPLHKLGTDRWSKAKRQALEKIRDTAAELLDVYAKRDASSGLVCRAPDENYRAFAAAFPFEETPDQQQAIDSVISDMTRPKPMDRLVCGDVGFGKTEVAMRAAFLAVNSGYQVAVLVPTTLLAQQHYQSFRDRFADTAINIELVSRFRSAGDIEKIGQKLKDGKIDILVGTHKLLQKELAFSQLGLLIIDEEHRFGVQQKEKMKALRANLDILTLTATPIPRTLNLAMQGVRDLSIIATPPARRLSVKTFVREENPNLIEEALLREILRGGQVFFLHNEVKSIEKRAREIGERVPDARIGVAHGQMRERELEQVMSDFYHKRFNVLVCTTIIETGIDIPSANTIVIERADKFGLAQLHQLRGRVGRSHHQAYAYLLTPPPKALTEDARKRLEAIAEAQDLGAGFTLATHDLEIRGAGELLGEEQSGHIQSVGFSLYMQLLEEAVETVRKGGKIDLDAPLQTGVEVNLRVPALIPEDYLPDVHGRLVLYKRMAAAKKTEQLEDLQVEMIDRFGLLPEAVKNLFRLTRVKQSAETLGIDRIDFGKSGGYLEFAANTRVEPMTLVKLIQTEPQRYKLEGTRLKVSQPLDENEKRLAFVEGLMGHLLKASPDR